MGYPLLPDEKGIKIIAQEMEPEKMYYCYHNNKVMLVYKDDQEFLNCYEIEEQEIVDIVKECKSPDEIEKIIQDYLAKNNLSIK